MKIFHKKALSFFMVSLLTLALSACGSDNTASSSSASNTMSAASSSSGSESLSESTTSSSGSEADANTESTQKSTSDENTSSKSADSASSAASSGESTESEEEPAGVKIKIENAEYSDSDLSDTIAILKERMEYLGKEADIEHYENHLYLDMEGGESTNDFIKKLLSVNSLVIKGTEGTTSLIMNDIDKTTFSAETGDYVISVTLKEDSKQKLETITTENIDKEVTFFIDGNSFNSFVSNAAITDGNIEIPGFGTDKEYCEMVSTFLNLGPMPLSMVYTS